MLPSSWPVRAFLSANGSHYGDGAVAQETSDCAVRRHLEMTIKLYESGGCAFSDHFRMHPDLDVGYRPVIRVHPKQPSQTLQPLGVSPDKCDLNDCVIPSFPVPMCELR